MYKVRVKHKGQVTVPARIRKKLNMDEGTLLEVEERPEGVLLKPMPEIKAGQVVGKKKYEEIVGELDKLRSEW